MQVVIDETDRGGAAAGKTLDKLDAVFSIGAGRQTMVMIRSGINPDGVAEFLTQFVTASHGAGKSAADTDDRLSRSLLAEPWIKSDQFKDIDRFEIQPCGDPVHTAIVDESEVILPEMKQGKGGAPFGDGVVRYGLVDFRKKAGGNLVCLPWARGRYWMMFHEVLEETKNRADRKEGNRFD